MNCPGLLNCPGLQAGDWRGSPDKGFSPKGLRLKRGVIICGYSLTTFSITI